MSQPKVEDLINTDDSDSMAVLFKTKNTATDGSIKSGYYAGEGDSQNTDNFDIPKSSEDYLMYAFTSAGAFRIYYDNKSNGECHLHVGSETVTIASDAKVELHVQSDGSLVVD